MTRSGGRLLAGGIGFAVAVGMCVAGPAGGLAALGCGTGAETRPSLEAGWLPADLEFTAEAILDDPDLIESVPELGTAELRLFALDGGRQIGVVTSIAGSDDDAGGHLVVLDPSASTQGEFLLSPPEASGPNGLMRQTWTGFERTFTVTYRGDPLADDERIDIERVLSGNESPTAVQVPAQVPGIGSVPVSLGSHGTVASYTHRDANGDQRAVALAAVRLCESADPLAIYRWWHGEGDEPVYHDVPSTLGGRDALWLSYRSPAGVGDHHVVVIDVDGSGLLAVIGTYALTEDEVSEVVMSLDFDGLG